MPSDAGGYGGRAVVRNHGPPAGELLLVCNDTPANLEHDACMDVDLSEFVAGMPKCELHVHLEGTLEPELKLALAERNGVDIGQRTVEEIRATYRFDSLASFLAVYYPAMQVLVTEQDFYDLAHAYLVRAASQNVRYAEMFFDPQVHMGRGVPIEAVVRGYHRA